MSSTEHNKDILSLELKNVQKNSSRVCCSCACTRYVMALLAFTGFVNVYALRVNLSVAIVQMDADTATPRNNNTAKVSFSINAPPFIASSIRVLTGPRSNKVTKATSARIAHFVYAPAAGWVLASFFIGYVLTQFPGGILAQWLGGKWVFGVGVGMTSLLTLLTPLAAFTNVWILVALRVLEGIFEVSKC